MNMIKYEQIPHESPEAMSHRDNFVSTVHVCTQSMLQLKPVSSLDILFMMHSNASFLANGCKGNTIIRLMLSLHLEKQIQVSAVVQQAFKSGKYWETTGDKPTGSPLYSQSQTCPVGK